VTGTDAREAARRRRMAAAERWRPDEIDLLLVDEAPPSALDRYFYFEHVPTQDSLFRHVVEAVLGEKPTRDKVPYLAALRDRGVFLIDLSDEPFHGRRAEIPRRVPGLVRRAARLHPRRIVLIGADVYDHVVQPLRDAGLPVVDVRLPYPGSGQQRRFLEGFREQDR
jgi:hypothetical protein